MLRKGEKSFASYTELVPRHLCFYRDVLLVHGVGWSTTAAHYGGRLRADATTGAR